MENANGSCGSASGVGTFNAPTANLCANGSSPSVNVGGENWTWTCAGTGNGTSATCTAPTCSGATCLFVVDGGNHRVAVYNTMGGYVGQFGQNDLHSPTGVTVDAQDTVWVMDTSYPASAPSSGGSDHLMGYRFNSTTGNYALWNQIGTSGRLNGQLFAPFAVTTDSDNNIWVADSGNSRVEAYLGFGRTYTLGNGQTITYPSSSAGGVFEQIGGTASACGNSAGACACYNLPPYNTCPSNAGSGAGQMSWPSAIAIYPNGNLIVVDTFNNRVEVYGTVKSSPQSQFHDGAFLEQFGSNALGFTSGSNEASGVAVDSSGYIWVSDFNNNRLVQFNGGGTVLQETASTHLSNPEGIAFDPTNNVLWVVNFGSNIVTEFDLSGNFKATVGQSGAYGNNPAVDGLPTGVGGGYPGLLSPHGIAIGH